MHIHQIVGAVFLYLIIDLEVHLLNILFPVPFTLQIVTAVCTFPPIWLSKLLRLTILHDDVQFPHLVSPLNKAHFFARIDHKVDGQAKEEKAERRQHKAANIITIQKTISVLFL